MIFTLINKYYSVVAVVYYYKFNTKLLSCTGECTVNQMKYFTKIHLKIIYMYHVSFKGAAQSGNQNGTQAPFYSAQDTKAFYLDFILSYVEIILTITLTKVFEVTSVSSQAGSI